MITKFSGKHDFLSNFYSSKIVYNGIEYDNNESAFQAQKTLEESVRREFMNLEPNLAKRKGRKVKIRPDWEQIKAEVMYEICIEKFKNKELLEKLLKTEDEVLIEGNYWHDNYWGNCTCEKCKSVFGKNNLGIILMKIRDDNRNKI